MAKEKNTAIKVIFFTVFLDLVGFGIIIPLAPYLADDMKATGLQVGMLMAIYSLMQFIFAPVWGRLSDRVGRRPIILMSLLGAALSYLVFAYAESLFMLFVARAFAGVFAANISTANAYIADVTPEGKRSVAMGIIGVAFGLGFILGPVIGGVAGKVGYMLGTTAPYGMQFSALVAAGLVAMNFAFAFYKLPESLTAEKRGQTSRESRSEGFSYVFKDKLLSLLLIVFLFVSLGMALMEVMMFLFLEDRFDWEYMTSSIAFAYVGVLMVLTQGYFIRKWIPQFGEKKVLFAGLIMMVVSFVGIGASFTILGLAISMTILAVGNGCMRPPIMGLTSVVASEDKQGLVMGMMHSMSAMGRIIGPILGGWLYDQVSEGAPFYGAGILTAVGLALFLLIYTKLTDPEHEKPSG